MLKELELVIDAIRISNPKHKMLRNRYFCIVMSTKI